MPVMNPVHPGVLGQANLKELHLSVSAAAKAMRVTRQQLSNVIQANTAVSRELALRLEKAFGGSANMWLRMQAAHDLAKARKREGEIYIPELSGASTASAVTSRWRVRQSRLW